MSDAEWEHRCAKAMQLAVKAREVGYKAADLAISDEARDRLVDLTGVPEPSAATWRAVIRGLEVIERRDVR